MLVLLSPAKKQNFDPVEIEHNASQPQNKANIKVLVDTLKQYKKPQLMTLMSISEKLAHLNYQRFQDFDPSKFNQNNAKPAAFAFQGDAYQTLNISDFNADQLAFAQQHLFILSGLYGHLRPLDLIQPYRLEMKTRLETPKASDLYQFWGESISQAINKALKAQADDLVINLASNEYFKAIKTQHINGKIITVQFKEKQGDAYKTIGIHAKRARGLMTRYIMKNGISDLKKLEKFKEANYHFNRQLSDDNQLVFTRTG